MTAGQTISFIYRNRFVKGVVDRVADKYIVLTLLSDYIGKNEEWHKGEQKDFPIKAIKDLYQYEKL